MPCPVCPHPQRHDLDQALLAANLTFAGLSRKYGPSLSPLWRHKKYLQGKMRLAENRPKNQREISAKLPENPPHYQVYIQQYQYNIFCRKYAPKNPGNGTSPLPFPTPIPTKLPVPKLGTRYSKLLPPPFSLFPFHFALSPFGMILSRHGR
jgi:hypothetical protein